MDKSKTNKLKKSRNKTKKNESGNVCAYYDKNFKNTPFIPTTEIITYMFNGYKSYKASHASRQDIKFGDIFEIGNDFPASKIFSIDKPIESNHSLFLKDLITYSFYYLQGSSFENLFNTNKTINDMIEILKYQMGKDLRRDDRIINGVDYPRNIIAVDEDTSNYAVEDNFYCILIKQYTSNIGNKIDYDLLNKISLLSCQNMFNLITGLISMQVREMIIPEVSTVYSHTKNNSIVINKDEITMELNFKSRLLISRNGEMDPEYPCGDLEFKFLIDFKNNSYKFTTFKLSYNINKCGPSLETDLPQPKPKKSLFSRFTRKNRKGQVAPESEQPQQQDVNQNQEPQEQSQNNSEPTINLTQEQIEQQILAGDTGENRNQNNNSKLIYLIPALGVTGALVSTPFILGVLGGKNTKKNRKRMNTITKKKHKK